MLTGPAVMQTLEPAYRRFRARLNCHMTRVVAVDPQALALFIIDHGDELASDWLAMNPKHDMPSPPDYELFLRQQYLKTMSKSRC